jgi:membrane-bound serine protease (ClpP class)
LTIGLAGGDNGVSMLAIVLTILAQAPVAPPPAGAGNNALLIWAILLICIAIILFFMEIFIPSGGLISVASAICLIAGIVMMFGVDTTLGLFVSAVSLIAIPFLIGFGLKIWPHTPMGRWLMLGGDDDDLDDLGVEGASDGSPQPAVGDTGRAITDLRPIGTCMLASGRCDCLAAGDMIKAGATIRVIAIDGMQIKVTPTDG